MRTVDEIYGDLTRALAAAGGAVSAQGGDMALRLRAVAAELFSLEAQAEFVARQSFPQTALGEYLDYHAALRGLVRGGALPAAGTLRFYLDAAAGEDTPVPAGTECLNAAGAAFRTLEAGVIPAGSLYADIPAEAVEAGSGGNVPSGSVVYLRLAPTGVTGVTNPAAFAGGTDGEGDEALRERVLSSYRSLPNGANAAYYENKVRSLEGVAAVTVLPRSRGLGTVDVVFSTRSGVPGAAELAAAQDLLDSEREICVDIRVLAPTVQSLDVTAELTVDEGADSAAVLAAARAAVEGYFDGRLLSRGVYRAGLTALLMGVEGVRNCLLTAPAEDLAPARGVLPRLGTLGLSEAE